MMMVRRFCADTLFHAKSRQPSRLACGRGPGRSRLRLYRSIPSRRAVRSDFSNAPRRGLRRFKYLWRSPIQQSAAPIPLLLARFVRRAGLPDATRGSANVRRCQTSKEDRSRTRCLSPSIGAIDSASRRQFRGVAASLQQGLQPDAASPPERSEGASQRSGLTLTVQSGMRYDVC